MSKTQHAVNLMTSAVALVNVAQRAREVVRTVLITMRKPRTGELVSGYS